LAGHVVVTGGAGYIGSVLVGQLLGRGAWVTVVDALHFGGEALLGWLSSPRFHFEKADLAVPGALAACARPKERGAPPVDAVVHLAAISSVPAAEAAGREAVRRSNVDAVRAVFDDAERLGARRFVMASTSSVYGRTPGGVEAVEDTPVNPLSLYAESKAEAEVALREASRGASTGHMIFRFATAFGLSPRMRFDLLPNQLVCQAFVRGEVTIYHGEHSRTFLHVRDIAEGVIAGLQAPNELVRDRVFNLGSESGNCTKNELAEMIRNALPETRILEAGGSMRGNDRDLRISSSRAREVLGFKPGWRIADGIDEMLGALRSGVFTNPESDRYRNVAPVMA
jgi:nucleoside-diphosphate-sugar epimerase